MKKKKIIIIVLFVISIIVLIPIPSNKNNGITEYKAILYKYTKFHATSEISFTGFEARWELKILGIRVAGNINTDKQLNKEQKIIGSILLEVIEETRTPKGATFTLTNTTDNDYVYGESYIIEKYDNGIWKEIDTLTNNPISWNAVLFTIKAGEEKEFNIDWSLVYGKLKSGTYRLIKNNLRKSNSAESRTYTLYAEFDIK